MTTLQLQQCSFLARYGGTLTPTGQAAILAALAELDEYRRAVAEWCSRHGGPPLATYTQQHMATSALFALAKRSREQ